MRYMPMLQNGLQVDLMTFDISMLKNVFLLGIKM